MGAKQEFSSAVNADATGFECKRCNLKKQITLKVNGVKREILVAPNELLLNVLRDRLGLTGAKYGCGIGECGSCTVLVDGEPVLSCLTLAIGLDGSDILTVEGLAEPRWKPPSDPGILPGTWGSPMRLLYAWNGSHGEISS